MIQIKDFIGPDGKADVRAYSQAKVEAGEACQACGAYIYLPASAGAMRRTCEPCTRLASDAARVAHPTLIRCPACGEIQPALYMGDRPETGSLARSCRACETPFEVDVIVSYEFTSPPRREGR